MSALSHFRQDPEKAIDRYDFMADAREGFRTTAIPNASRCEYGGPCTLKEGKTVNGVTRLLVSCGGTATDYFFPWVNRGVGEVRVPAGSANGTIVVTGGMNGCGLVVTKNGPHLVFYHDADNCYLGVLRAANGTTVCSVAPRDYMGPLNIGESLVGGGATGNAYLHQLLIIKSGGKWKVFSCGIIIGPGIDMPPLRSFRATITKYICSFD